MLVGSRWREVGEVKEEEGGAKAEKEEEGRKRGGGRVHISTHPDSLKVSQYRFECLFSMPLLPGGAGRGRGRGREGGSGERPRVHPPVVGVDSGA